MSSDTVLQICYSLFSDWLHCPDAELVERLAEVKRFAAQFYSNPAGLGVCRSCWSLFSNETRHGTCSGACAFATEYREVPHLRGIPFGKGGLPCPT